MGCLDGLNAEEYFLQGHIQYILVCVVPSLQLCIDVQIPESFGGLGGQAVFVDTEGSLVVQRVMDLAHAAVQHCSLQDHDSEQQEAMKDFTMETILDHLYLVG